MDESIAWLPELELLSDYDGDWGHYLEGIYEIFKADFVNQKPIFRGQPLRLKRYPITHDKEATFWHMVSSGEVEADRLPDLRRCERIRWPKQVIENEYMDEIRVWEEMKNGNTRIHLWLYAEDSLVVLDKRYRYCLPWTAYYVEYNHQRRKLDKRWESSINKKLAAPIRTGP